MAGRARPLFKNFSGGEIAPQLDGLIDGPAHGCLTLENFVVRKQAGIMRRPGTKYAGAANSDSQTTRLYPFTNAAGTSFVIEFSDETIRIWKQSTHAVVDTISGAPYDQTDVFGLKFLAIGDELRITHRGYRPRVLTWVSDSSFTIDTVDTQKNNQWFMCTSGGLIVNSIDGINWIERPLPQTSLATPIGGMIWGNGKLMAMTNGGGADVVFISSDNGANWVSVSPTGTAALGNCYDGAYGNGYYVFAGAEGGSGRIIYSADDGATWSGTNISNLVAANAIEYSPSLGLWIVGGQVMAVSGTYVMSGSIMTSPDLVTWTGRGGLGASITPQDILDASGKLYVAAIHAMVAYSSDGITWTAVNCGVDHPFALAAVGDSVLVLGDDGNPTPASKLASRSISGDGGVTWGKLPVQTGETQFLCAHDVGGVTIVGAPTKIYVSLDNGYIFSPIATITNWPSRVVAGPDFTFDVSGSYPCSVAFQDQRVLYAGSSDDTDTVWGSKVNDLDNFSTGYLATDGLEYRLAGRRNANIYWMEPVNRGVCIGAENGVGFLIGSQDAGLTPLSVQFDWVYPHGCSEVQGIRVGQEVFYAQRGGEVLRAFPSDAEITLLSSHVTKGGVTQFEYLDDPQCIFFAVRSDGELPMMTVEKNVSAWQRWVTRDGDEIESIAIVPAGTEDEIWTVTKRVIGASTKRFIEYSVPFAIEDKDHAHFVDAGVEQENADEAAITGVTKANPAVVTSSGHPFSNGDYVLIRGVGGMIELNNEVYQISGKLTDSFELKSTDSTLFTTYTSGGYAYEVSASVSGLAHLNGEECVALIDGNVVETVTPSAGVVTLARKGHHVHVGLAFSSKAQLCRMGTGLAHGIPKQVSKLFAWVHETIGGEFGSSETKTEAVDYDAGSELTTGLLALPYPGDWDADSYIWVIQDDPLPMTVLAVGPEVTVGER